MLSVREIERYLQRIGYAGGVTPSLAALQALMTCHLQTVPYETVTIHRSGKAPSLRTADLYAKIVEGHGGGYCLELNTLFQTLLGSLGYAARPCFCRSTDTPGRVDPINHRGVLVESGGRTCLADVGWGGPMARGPLPLEPGIWEVAGKRYEVARISEHWLSIDRFSSQVGEDGSPVRMGIMELCLAEVLDEDFAALNRELSSPGSEFRDTEMANISTPGGYLALTGRKLTVADGGRKEVRELAPAEVDRVLEERFGLVVCA